MAGGETSGTPVRLPQQFGNYSILEHLATGGFAEVYLARKVGLQGFEKFVVIKRIRPELTHEPRTMALLLDEARLVATLEHPNIVQVYEIERVSESYFIVMEYVQGADLRQIIEAARKSSRKISLDDVVYIVSHVCAALHYAHEKCDNDGNPLEIIHRDISPSNVLVSHDGGVKVCDFGIAKGRNRTTETVEGVIKGKLSYMSPEQCKSERLDRAADIFAIGVVLYELSTLTKLFTADSEFEMLRTIIEDPIPHPSQRMAGYPDGLGDIVMRALAKKRADRYPTAQAMQEDLEAFAREHRLSMSSINIARLMGRLFERTSGPYRPSHGFKEGDADTDVDTKEVRAEGTPERHTPTPPVDENIATPKMPPRVSRTQPPAPAAAEARRPNVAWLVAAAFVGAAATASTMIPTTATSTASVEQALRADVERLGATIDATARASQLEVARFAATPMLAAAISTDAATLRDLAANEHVLAAAPGEVLEVFQLRGGATTSMLRLPADALPLPAPSSPGQLQIASDGRELRLIASAPINGKGVTGAVSASAPVDLALTIQSIAKSTRNARLTGVTPELALVTNTEGVSGTTVSIPAPSAVLASPLVVIATIEATAERPAWLTAAPLVGGGIAILLLVCYAVLLLSRRRDD